MRFFTSGFQQDQKKKRKKETKWQGAVLQQQQKKKESQIYRGIISTILKAYTTRRSKQFFFLQIHILHKV